MLTTAMIVPQKLILVTVLLLFLSYTGVYVYTSACVFAITVIATYVCYTLNTQLRLENYLKYLKYLKRFLGLGMVIFLCSFYFFR